MEKNIKLIIHRQYDCIQEKPIKSVKAKPTWIVMQTSNAAEYKVNMKTQFCFYKLAKDHRKCSSTKNIKSINKKFF